MLSHTLGPPSCVDCAGLLDANTDTFKNGRWKQRCYTCRNITRNHIPQKHSHSRSKSDAVSPPAKRRPPPQLSCGEQVIDLSPIPRLLQEAIMPTSSPLASSFPSVPFTPQSGSSQVNLENVFSTSISLGISPSTNYASSLDITDFKAAESLAYELPPRPPIIRFNEADYLDDPAISDKDRRLIGQFYKALNKERMESCKICNRYWFRLDIHREECASCRNDRIKYSLESDWIPLYGTENNMNPGTMPSELPRLTDIEEMLIARVHVLMEIRQHRGLQWKYRGHICHFAVNVGRTFSRLPLLPSQLDIIILRPPRSDEDDQNRIERQFKRDFKVRRAAVITWLTFLKNNHPGYSDITIDMDAAAQLPEDGSVHEHLVHINQDESMVGPGTGPDTQAEPSFTPTGSAPQQTPNTPTNTWTNTAESIRQSDASRPDTDYGSFECSNTTSINVEEDLPPDTSAIPDLVKPVGISPGIRPLLIYIAPEAAQASAVITGQKNKRVATKSPRKKPAPAQRNKTAVVRGRKNQGGKSVQNGQVTGGITPRRPRRKFNPDRVPIWNKRRGGSKFF